MDRFRSKYMDIFQQDLLGYTYTLTGNGFSVCIPFYTPNSIFIRYLYFDIIVIKHIGQYAELESFVYLYGQFIDPVYIDVLGIVEIIGIHTQGGIVGYAFRHQSPSISHFQQSSDLVVGILIVGGTVPGITMDAQRGDFIIAYDQSF